MTAPSGRPGRADGRDEAVRLALRTVERLVALDTDRGARAAVPAVREAVRRIPELSAAPRTLRGHDPDHLAALAELSEVIGWILFDAGRYAHARRMNARALALAELCGDRWTARLVLLNHSMLTTHTGQPRAALDAAARVSGPRPLPARVASLVLIRQAHASALLGGRGRPLELISRARSRFLDGVSRRDPHWAWWIDEAELLGHEGWVQARLRRWDRAIPLLHQAATAPGPSYRHLFTAELLSALARAGAWREAEDLIARVAPGAAAIGSVRTTETLARTAAGLRRRDTGAPAPLRDAAAFLLESLPA
ncbi:DNA-binding protein [Streptomyces sp. NBC_00091]|uniref:DNA-binding protein n=1 Tax=Streptomyces sp. NBC_00091 TaxID=2975648 RepID=UPI0022548184|nr:DNA-binding protein [Streptomyces sp. NBC_00091]MCX5374950.1 DNA-binding protein [Streptomyces sp. NBC_00091]